MNRRGQTASNNVRKSLEGPFTAIARATSKKWDVQVVPGGTRCETDGKRILFPWNIDQIESIDFAVLNGYLDHEVGHIVEEREHREAGRRTPLEIVRAEPMKSKNLLFNAFEDVRMEMRRAAEYIGVAQNLAAANVHSAQKIAARGVAERSFWEAIGAMIILQAHGLPLAGFSPTHLWAFSTIAGEAAQATSTRWAQDSKRLADQAWEKLQALTESSPKSDKNEEDEDDYSEGDDASGDESDEDDSGESGDEEGDSAEASGEEGENEEESNGAAGGEEDEGSEDGDSEESSEAGEGDEEDQDESVAGDAGKDDSEDGDGGEESDADESDAGESSDGDSEEGDGDGNDKSDAGEDGGEEGDTTDGDASEEDSEGDSAGDEAPSSFKPGERPETGETASDKPESVETELPEPGDGELEDLSREIAEEPAVDHLMEELADEISEAATDAARAGYVPDPVMRAADVWIEAHEYPQSQYDDIQEDVRAQISALKAKLLTVMAARTEARTEFDQDAGFLDTGALHQLRVGSTRVFSRVIPGIEIDTAVEILVDLSGSMGYAGSKGTKACQARMVSIALGETFDALKVPFEVIGFHNTIPMGRRDLHARSRTEGDGVTYPRFPFEFQIYKAFNDNFKKVRRRFVGISGRDQNADGEAVMEAAKRLALRPEKRKILFVLSDGEPCCPGVPFPVAAANLRDAVTRVTRSGIEVFGVGMNHKTIGSFYGPAQGAQSVVITKTEDMAREIFKAIRLKFLGRAA